LNPSRFRHRIELFQRTTSTDNLLQEIEVYVSYGKLWADIKTIRGQQYLEAGHEGQNKTTRFIIRESKTLEQFMQSDKTSFEIEFKGVRYDVRDAMNDDELNKTVTIVAEGRV